MSEPVCTHIDCNSLDPQSLLGAARAVADALDRYCRIAREPSRDWAPGGLPPAWRLAEAR